MLNPNIQIASVMYSNSNGDLPTMTCKTQSDSQDTTEEQIPCAQPWSLITLLDSTLLNLYPCSTSASTPTIRYSTSQLYSILFSTLPPLYSYSTHRFSSLRCSATVYSALLFPTILYSTRLYLYSASILLYLDSTSRRCPLDTVISGLGRMWLHDLLTQVSTGHNDLWASENVSYWSLKAHANWTQWSLG